MLCMLLFFIILRPPSPTCSSTLFPSTSHFQSRESAEADRADSQALHRAADARDSNHVALVDGVLELDEDAGDDVLHQLLRTEPDGQPDDAGAGQQDRKSTRLNYSN